MGEELAGRQLWPSRQGEDEVEVVKLARREAGLSADPASERFVFTCFWVSRGHRHHSHFTEEKAEGQKK